MKALLKNTIIKKILIVFVIIIMISNFIMPNYVQAAVLDAIGAQLVSGFFQLLTYVGDVALSAMQRMMKGTWDLQEYGEYAIKYSPGMIFANEVAALDVNFISAKEGDMDVVTNYYSSADSDNEMDKLIKEVNRLVGEGTLTKEYVASIDASDTYSHDGEVIYNTDDAGNNLLDNYGVEDIMFYNQSNLTSLHTSERVIYCKEASKEFYGWKNLWDNDIKNIIDLPSSQVYLYTLGDYLYQWEVVNVNRYIEIYRYNISELSAKEQVKIQSTAYQLRGTIATWYTALRTIALVGLLSVLLYLGIRIILSSTSAQDKAKYKNMLKDWLVALCILFVLHYIMAFLLNITERLNNMLASNVIAETTSDSTLSNGNKIDKLMSEVRNKVDGDADESPFSNMEGAFDVAGNAIMYLALVVLTGIFTVQYLKRVVFMAFLTIIAPMIALTYPLDKVKDGKAQAFSYWLREYIFNCLIQPVHLLLYTVLIVSAFEFAQENILYSIVALAFMVPAEKFIKEMFGMKSSSPTGTIGAAAGGALVMSMLNKIKSKPPKEGAEAAGAGAASSPSGTRTAKQAYGTNSQVPQPQGVLQAQGQSQAQAQQAQTSPQMATQGVSRTTGQQTSQGRQPTDHLQMLQAPGQREPSIARGLHAVGKKYIYGVDTWKTIGRKFGGAVVGAATGTAALAAQVADGDLFDNPEKALQEIGVTAGIGYAAGNNFTGNRIQGLSNGLSTFKKGVYGEENYNNKQLAKQFLKSDTYKTIKKDPEIIKKYDKDDIEKVVNSYFDQGITDENVIKDGMKAGVNGNEYKAASSLGVTDVKDYARVRDKNANKQLNAAQIAARMQIAKNMPEKLYNDENGFVRYAKRYGIENEEDARRLFREIDDFI